MTAGDQPYPTYSRAERIADGIIHAVGVMLALSGVIVLIVFAAFWARDGGARGGAGHVAALAVYGGALLASLVASACYHMTPWERVRPALRRIDHAAIYLKIAGTYTPLVALIGSAFAWVVLGVVWALAITGMVLKLAFWRDPGRLATAFYLVLGWIGLLLIWPMVQTLPVAVLILVACGGVLYSAGVVFFTWDSLRYSNAIWHGFVLVASGCFFAAITLGTFA